MGWKNGKKKGQKILGWETKNIENDFSYQPQEDELLNLLPVTKLFIIVFINAL